MEWRKTILSSLEDTIKAFHEKMHILDIVHSYLISSSMLMEVVLLYKSITLQNKIIHSLNELNDFIVKRIKTK